MTSRIPYKSIVAGLGLAMAGYFLVRPAAAPSPHPANGASAALARKEALRGEAPLAQWGMSPFGRGSSVEGAAERAGNAEAAPIYGRNGRAIDFGGKSAAQFIAQWSAPARTGDPDAAYKVYQAETVCANNDEAVADYQDATQREQFMRARAGLEKLCQGVAPMQVRERMQFLAAAARAGRVDAQIDFYMEGPNGQPLTADADGADPQLKQWKEDALLNLKGAAGQGDTFALALLSLAYDVGQLVPHDAKLSLAYTVAEAAARNVAPQEAQLRSRFGAQMSVADFSEGQRIGAQIARDCCKRVGPQ